MEYDQKAKKVIAILLETLPSGVALNVLGHLALAIGNTLQSQ
jgi:hypothetical protein